MPHKNLRVTKTIQELRKMKYLEESFEPGYIGFCSREMKIG